MFVAGHPYTFFALGILWQWGWERYAPGWYDLQVLLAVSILGAMGMERVLTQPCPHCGERKGRAARRCPSCKRSHVRHT